MNFDSKSAAKSAAKSLRRELKALFGDAGDLNHAACLDLLSRVSGAADWNTLGASLKDESSAEAVGRAEPPAKASLALSNLGGRFDFPAEEEEAAYIPVSSQFSRMRGLLESALVTSNVDVAFRKRDGGIDADFGETEVSFESTESEIDSDGRPLWVTADGSNLPETLVVLVPEGRHKGVRASKSLPVRQALVNEFVKYLNACGLQEDLAAQLTAAQALDQLAFALTLREEEAVLAALAR